MNMALISLIIGFDTQAKFRVRAVGPGTSVLSMLDSINWSQWPRERKYHMKSSSKRFTIRATLFAGLFFLFSATANAELTLEVTTSTATDLDFTVTGDFSGYTPPASLSNFLYLVPMDSQGNPVTTWVPSEQTGDRPAGAIDGNTINGWVFVAGDVRSDAYSFLTGDGFNVSFGSGPYDSNSVMTSPYTRSQSGLTLNPADIAYFNLYWGRTVLLATTGAEDGTARFNVTKTFSNGDTSDVEVTLTCNGGIPLEQSFTISGDGPGVTFTVTNLPDVGADCEITESGGPDGYTNNADACSWTGVTSGLQTCAITNTPEPSEFAVDIDFDGIEDPAIDLDWDLEVVCTPAADAADDITFPGVTWNLSGSGSYMNTFTFFAEPEDGTDCTATLSGLSSAIEQDGACTIEEIAVGEADDPDTDEDETPTCSITATAFYEGIPTLSQYGLALMALLMLGVGFVGFRRFV
jgi:hypothetical protein